MRVLQICKTSVGASWALRQMRELVKLGVEVHAVLPPGGPLLPKYEECGVTVHTLACDLPVKQPWRLFEIVSKLRQIVDQVEPDVIHSHFVGTSLVMRLALGKKHPTPRIFQVPGPLHLEHSFFRWLEISSAGDQDSWVASCEWTRACYKASGIQDERLFLSYYGTDVDRFVPIRTGKLRREKGLSDNTKIIGIVAYMYAPKYYIGQTRGLKGHEDLIDAVEICLKGGLDAALVFVGGAWGNRTAYEKRVRDYGERRLGDRMICLGTRRDVIELYSEMDVAVHPSHSENCGGAVESLLLGVPTIATNVGGFPDLVIDGVTGWLVPPRDPPKLAEAILEVISDSKRSMEMAEEGRKRTSHTFDIRRNAREIYDVYEQLVSRNQS